MSESPKAIQAERALLGGLMQDPDQLAEMPGGLNPSAFYRPEHGALYAMLSERYRRREPIDLVTIPEAVARSGRHERYGGTAYVLELPDAVSSTANLPHYAAMVVDAHVRRVVQDRCRRAVEDAPTATSGIELAAAVAGVLAALASDGIGATATDYTADTLEHLTWLSEQGRGDAPAAVSTGLVALDDKMGGGLRSGELTVLAARPGMGKSAIALNIADFVAQSGSTVGLLTMEMDHRQVRTRVMSQRTGIALGSLRSPANLTPDEIAALQQCAEMDVATDARLHIDDRTALTVDQARAKAIQWHRQAPTDAPMVLLVCDYLTLMSGLGSSGSDRALLVGQAAQSFKDLAKDLGIHVLLLAQLNRGSEKRANKRPIMSDLRESGGIEQAANIILFMHRPEYYRVQAGEASEAVEGVEQDAECIIAKQRDGETGSVRLAFEGPTVRFTDVDSVEVRL
ncbi:MAG: replicative DNA helicase [Myxococcota bacterium]